MCFLLDLFDKLDLSDATRFQRLYRRSIFGASWRKQSSPWLVMDTYPTIILVSPLIFWKLSVSLGPVVRKHVKFGLLEPANRWRSRLWCSLRSRKMTLSCMILKLQTVIVHFWIDRQWIYTKESKNFLFSLKGYLSTKNNFFCKMRNYLGLKLLCCLKLVW